MSSRKSPRRWMQKAVRRPGALRERLQDLGLVKPGRNIPMKALRQAASGVFGPQTARRARLALVWRGSRKGKEKKT